MTRGMLRTWLTSAKEEEERAQTDVWVLATGSREDH